MIPRETQGDETSHGSYTLYRASRRALDLAARELFGVGRRRSFIKSNLTAPCGSLSASTATSSRVSPSILTFRRSPKRKFKLKVAIYIAMEVADIWCKPTVICCDPRGIPHDQHLLKPEPQKSSSIPRELNHGHYDPFLFVHHHLSSPLDPAQNYYHRVEQRSPKPTTNAIRSLVPQRRSDIMKTNTGIIPQFTAHRHPQTGDDTAYSIFVGFLGSK